jgi:hypothetical protein
MKSGTAWLSADAELPIHIKRTIASKKRMLIVFWEIHWIVNYGWLPKDSILDSPFFVKKCFLHSLRKCSHIPKISQILHFDSYGQCKGSQSKGNPREIGCFPIRTHAAATVQPEYCTIRLFFSVGEKPSLSRENIIWKVNYMK